MVASARACRLEGSGRVALSVVDAVKHGHDCTSSSRADPTFSSTTSPLATWRKPSPLDWHKLASRFFSSAQPYCGKNPRSESSYSIVPHFCRNAQPTTWAHASLFQDLMRLPCL